MKSGIDPPVRNPTRSLVKELQLKSIEMVLNKISVVSNIAQ